EAPRAAAREIAEFDRNFHSSRRFKERLVMRLNHALSDATLDHLNEHFADLCLSGQFEQQSCCEQELDEPELQSLPRLSFVFNGRDHGRLRERSEEHTSELQSRENLVCRLLLEKKKRKITQVIRK